MASVTNNHKMNAKNEEIPTCSICYKKVTNPIQLKCKHIFDLTCIEGWMKQKQNCPLCRDKVTPGGDYSFMPELQAKAADLFTVIIQGKQAKVTLNPKNLADDQIHLFFPLNPLNNMELRIVRLIEELLFQSDDSERAAQFDISVVEILPELSFFWCRFPKEYAPAALHIAELFGLQIMNKGRGVLTINPKTGGTQRVHFPASTKLLSFHGERTSSEEQLDQRAFEVREHFRQLGELCQGFAKLSLSK